MFLRIWLAHVIALTLLAGQDNIPSSDIADISALHVSHDSNITIAAAEDDIISGKEKLDDVTQADILKERQRQENVENDAVMKEVQERLDAGESPVPEAEVLKMDTITVKGAVLQGQITELNADYVRFNLIYGQGSIRIDYNDIEQLLTEHVYHIFYKGKQTEGKVVGIKDHAWLIVKHGEVEEIIKIENIDRFILSTKENDSLNNQLHNLFPYTKGNFDVGMEYESGTNVKRKLSVATHIERKVTVHRTVFDLKFAYETTRTGDNPETLNKDEWLVFAEQDYYVTKNSFLFGQMGYDYDEPRGIQGRIYPSAGTGFRLKKDNDIWSQFKIGAGYVDERFYNYGSNAYFSAYFGISGHYTMRDLMFLDHLIFDAGVFYMPGFFKPDENWLARYKGSISLPLGEAMALRFVMNQVKDDNPSPEVGNNKFTMDLYLSFVF